MAFIEWFVNLWRRLSPESAASATAHLVAPALVVVLAITGTSGHSPFDFTRPVSVAHLQSLVSANGVVVSQPGVAITIEPTSTELALGFRSQQSQVWTSLDSSEVQANRSHIGLESGMLTMTAPYIGVDGPVTVVVEGKSEDWLLFPGGAERLSDFAPASKRSLTLVYSVLMVCVFAFGMSIATALPFVRDK